MGDWKMETRNLIHGRNDLKNSVSPRGAEDSHRTKIGSQIPRMFGQRPSGNVEGLGLGTWSGE